MFDRSSRLKTDRTQTIPIARHNRIVVMLVAVCCLSMGIAIGAIVHGIAGAKSDDNRVSISYAPSRPDALSAAFARVVEQIEPSVVNVKVTEGEEHTMFARDGTGSGIIVNGAGYILTNQHVIDRATTIKVKLLSGAEYDAKVVGKDRDIDLAVVKIDAKEPLVAARLGDSDKLNVGDWVLAIGSPFGFEHTVTAGIISAKNRDPETSGSVFQQFIQTDAAINPGNSGGPLVNLAGEVIGINTQIATNTGWYNGIGFALPSSTAVDIYNQLVTTGRVQRGFLGIHPQDLTPQIARLNHIQDNQGVVIRDLTSDDSPAGRAGLKSEDIIISINGQKVKNYRDLIRRISALPVGSTASIDYIRDGQQHTASVKLEERVEPKTEDAPDLKIIPFDPHHPRSTTPLDPEFEKRDKPERKHTIGLNVQTLTPDRAKQRGLDGIRGALVVFVERDGLGTRNGLRENDVVIEINHRHITNEEDYLRATRDLKSGDDVVIRVLRGSAEGPRKYESFIASFTMP